MISPLRKFAPFAVSVLTIGNITILELSVERLFGHFLAPFQLLSLAVASITLLYGQKHGLFTMFLGFLVGDFFFTRRYYSFTLEHAEDAVILLVYLVCCSVVTYLHRKIELTAQNLRENEFRSRSFFNGVKDQAFMLLNVNGKISAWNTGAEIMTGYSAHEVIGSHVSSLFPTSPVQKATWQEALTIATEQGKYETEDWIARKNGSSFWAHVTVNAVYGSSGALSGFSQIMRDLTIQQQVADARKTLQELQVINQLQDDFLSTVSHELRSPIANLKMAVNLLLVLLQQDGDLNKQRARFENYVTLIDGECDRELELVNDLLDLQRLNSGVKEPNEAVIDLHTWLPKLVSSFGARAEKRELRLHIKIEPELKPIVTDPADLERVLRELIHNACKYSPPSGQIWIRALQLDGLAHFEVTNTGVEIPVNHLPRVFDKFYRVPDADKWRQGGTGLGLAIVHSLVVYLGGDITVESGEDSVSFLVDLPFRIPSATPIFHTIF